MLWKLWCLWFVDFLGMTPLFKKLLGMNWVLVLVMFGLLGLGIFTIESAARHLPSGGEAIAKRQQMWVMVGAVVYFVTALIDYRWTKYLGIPMYLAGLGMMVAAMVAGNDVHQLEVGGLSFQPAQFMVVAGFILLAMLLQELPRWNPLFGLPIVKVAVIGVLTMIPFAMVAKMGDMGSALVWLPVVGVVMLVGGVPFRYLTLMILMGFAAIPPLFFIVLPKQSERGTQRIELFLDMAKGREVDITDEGYAPYYIGMAVGKAGWKGEGWNAGENTDSLHAKGYIPKKTAHNDFIYAVFAEEQGFRGSLILVTGYGVLMIVCLFVAFYSRDLSGQVMVASVVTLFFAHFFESLGMCVHLMPITGIPLPLISYSGTFVIMCMFMLGLVQSVWVHRKLGVSMEGEEEVKLSKRGKVAKVNKVRGAGERVNPNEGVKRGEAL